MFFFVKNDLTCRMFVIAVWLMFQNQLICLTLDTYLQVQFSSDAKTNYFVVMFSCRFYLDAGTAQTMSRQNSCASDTETPSPSLCKSCGKVCINLNEITEPSLSLQEDEVKHLKSESHTPDSTQSCICDAVNVSPAVDDEDKKNVIHEVLSSIIDQIAECEDKHVGDKTAKCKGSPMLVQENLASRDIHSVSPVSEDSGIGCSLSHADDGKAEDADLAEHLDHSQNSQVNGSAVTQASSDSAKPDYDENQPAYSQGHSGELELQHSSRSSLFSALSSNVKYWLGQGTYGKHDGKFYSLTLLL